MSSVAGVFFYYNLCHEVLKKITPVELTYSELFYFYVYL